MRGRILTASQQKLAEDAMSLVPSAIGAFYYRHPALRPHLRQVDAKSVAYLAICRAATTYDPAKSKITTYFGTAIFHALLKACDRNIRHGYSSRLRVPLEMAERPDARKNGLERSVRAALARLPERLRVVVAMRYFQGLSLDAIGHAVRADPRTVSKLLRQAMQALESALENDLIPP